MNKRPFARAAGAFLITALAAVSVFAGGSKEAAAAPEAKEIDVWMINNPVPEIIAAFDEAAADFTAESGIKVNYVRIPTNDFHTKLVTNVAAKQYPAMVVWNINPGLEFSETGAVEPLADVVSQVGKDKFSDSVLRMFQLGGVQYEVPFLSRLSGLHYRKDWLKAAGLNPEPEKDASGRLVVKALDSWEDVLATAKKITDASQNRYGAGFQYSRKGFGDSAGTTQMLVNSFDGHFLDPKTGKVAINSKESVEAFAFLKKFYESGAMPESVVTWDGNANNLNFLNGTVGIVMNSNSILAKVGVGSNTTFSKDDVGIAPPPKGPRGTRVQSASPESLTIFKTPAASAAKKFALYLLKKDTQVKMFKKMGVGYYGPLRADVIDDPFFSTIGQRERMFLEANKYIAGIGYPGDPNPKLNAAYNSFVWDDALSRIAVDKWTPEQTVKEIEDKVKSAFE